jgi:hypothetical protein
MLALSAVIIATTIAAVTSRVIRVPPEAARA